MNPNDLTTSFTGQPDVGQPYNTQRVDGYFKLPGTATFTNGFEAYVLFTDETPTSELLKSPEVFDKGSNSAIAADSMLVTDHTYYAPYDPAASVGDNITLDAAHTDVVGTPYADEIYAGPGNDTIDAGDGNNVVFGGSGNDVIMAEGHGVNTLIGGTGKSLFILQSSMPGNLIQGGQGADWIEAYAPSTTIVGGPGNDAFQLSAKSSGGSEITDHAGINALTINDSSVRLRFQQDGFGLLILLNGDKTFDGSRDVVWTDFFASASNSVNGLSAAFLANATKDGAFDQGVIDLSSMNGRVGAGTPSGDSQAQGRGSSPTYASTLASTVSPIDTTVPLHIP